MKNFQFVLKNHIVCLILTAGTVNVHKNVFSFRYIFVLI